MKLLTLRGLEAIAEKQWEEKAKQLVRAIAEQEGVDFNQLYPYLVDYSFGNGRVDAIFKLPGHTAIRLFGGYGHRAPANLVNGEIDGDYGWMAWAYRKMGSPAFTGCENLGEALLLARWAYEQDNRALYR